MNINRTVMAVVLSSAMVMGANWIQAADTPPLSQKVTVAGSQASAKGSPDFFTGSVRVDPLFPVNDVAQFSGSYVTFEPGARSAWHIHPKGQHLVVTSGVGWTQEWGGPVVEIHAGDVVWCPPGIKHWHGATSKTAMTHIALTGSANGKNVEWLEKVSDEQYHKREESLRTLRDPGMLSTDGERS